jgi:hypothetical protein
MDTVCNKDLGTADMMDGSVTGSLVVHNMVDVDFGYFFHNMYHNHQSHLDMVSDIQRGLRPHNS